jgi:hypothetical protein
MDRIGEDATSARSSSTAAETRSTASTTSQPADLVSPIRIRLRGEHGRPYAGDERAPLQGHEFAAVSSMAGTLGSGSDC